jgi:hypothetical protein
VKSNWNRFEAEILFLNPNDVPPAVEALAAVGCEFEIDHDAIDPCGPTVFGWVAGATELSEDDIGDWLLACVMPNGKPLGECTGIPAPPPARNRREALAAWRRAFDALRARPPTAVDQLRKLTQRHARHADQVAAARRAARCAARRRAQCRPDRLDEVSHVRPNPTPRPRTGPAPVVAVGGSDVGGEKRDDGGSGSDGGGDDGDSGGGGGDPPPPRSRSSSPSAGRC